MTYLADVNVWVALALAGHVHNAIAQQWFEEAETERILFCRTTQKGLLRLLTNSRHGRKMSGRLKARGIFTMLSTGIRG